MPLQKSPESVVDAPAGIDLEVFDQVLSVGGPAFGISLARQLIADLERIGTELDSPDRARGAAHELKGVSATIGARELADMAMLYEVMLDTNAKSDALIQCDELRERIAGVCTLLQSRTIGRPADSATA